MSKTNDDIAQAEFIKQFSAPPSTKTQDEVIALINAHQGDINDLHIMYCMFEMTPSRQAQVRARRRKTDTSELPPRIFSHVKGICEEAANAVVKQDVTYFVKKYQYKQMVLTRETIKSELFWMGPFHTPAITASNSGKPKAYPSLKEALIFSTTVFKSK